MTKNKNIQNLQQIPTNTNTNLRATTRGNKRSKEEVLRIKNDIFTLSDNHTDYEIMNILGIPNSTYYEYKDKMYEEAKRLWDQTRKESLEYRALHMIYSINLALTINKGIATDSNNKAQDRIEASKNMVDIEMTYLNLLKEAPQSLED